MWFQSNIFLLLKYTCSWFPLFPLYFFTKLVWSHSSRLNVTNRGRRIQQMNRIQQSKWEKDTNDIPSPMKLNPLFSSFGQLHFFPPLMVWLFSLFFCFCTWNFCYKSWEGEREVKRARIRIKSKSMEFQPSNFKEQLSEQKFFV